ncbi:MAG TPA: toll/interleukin-1 receptor domain-containing protein, partial [Pyrinomonadaceae bacterium]
MRPNFLKSLDADDIFISYSRRDGSAYLTGLDAALSKRGFSCFTDKRGTAAGRLPPKTLYRKVRNCKTLVLLASPGAQERSENITPELETFAEHNGTARIICVSFDAGVPFDDFPDFWERFVVGKAREREAP